MPAGDESIVVECSVRTPLVLEPVDDHVETLQELETEGVVDEVVFRSWPDEVRLDAEEPAHEAVDRYERFRRWAARNDVSVRPPFETRSRTSPVSDGPREVLVTPLCCLAVYVDDRLVGVYPHSADGETYTAEGAVDELRDGTLPGTLAGPVRARECPSCDGQLDNGQGLFACSGCGWVGTATTDGNHVQFEARPGGDYRGGRVELTPDGR